MNDNKSNIATIRLDRKTRDRLKNYGTKGQTYDTIIIQLMDIYDAYYDTNSKNNVNYYDGAVIE